MKALPIIALFIVMNTAVSAKGYSTLQDFIGGKPEDVSTLNAGDAAAEIRKQQSQQKPAQQAQAAPAQLQQASQPVAAPITVPQDGRDCYQHEGDTAYVCVDRNAALPSSFFPLKDGDMRVRAHYKKNGESELPTVVAVCNPGCKWVDQDEVEAEKASAKVANNYRSQPVPYPPQYAVQCNLYDPYDIRCPGYNMPAPIAYYGTYLPYPSAYRDHGIRLCVFGCNGGWRGGHRGGRRW